VRKGILVFFLLAGSEVSNKIYFRKHFEKKKIEFFPILVLLLFCIAISKSFLDYTVRFKIQFATII